MPFGLQGASSVLMWVMNTALTRDLHTTTAEAVTLQQLDPKVDQGIHGASGPLHLSMVVNIDNHLYYSLSLEQHLCDTREVNVILQQEKLSVKEARSWVSWVMGSRARVCLQCPWTPTGSE